MDAGIIKELLEGVCHEWRPDFEKLLTGSSEYHKEFSNHKNNCLPCQSAYNRALEYLVTTVRALAEDLAKALEDAKKESTERATLAPIVEKAKVLEGKKVVKVELTGRELKLTFDDGSSLIAAARSGSGLGSEWFEWTEVVLQTPSERVTLINK